MQLTRKRIKRTSLNNMHLNRRTSTLLAAGVLSFAAVTHAEESANAISAALSSTTISGYVDTSAQWNFGTGDQNLPPYAFGGSDKADGFNLNVVQLSIGKALDDAEWAAGYQADFWFGPDANTLASTSTGESSSDFVIRQAYVALRTPVGNGIESKIGVFDTVIGYEVLGSPNDPNFTRSWGFTIEPTTHTGIQSSYKISDALSVNAGVADTVGPTINGRAFPTDNPTSGNKAEAYKAYLGSITLTAPEDWGWAKGSTLSGGVVNGFSSSFGENVTSWYVGSTLNTPVTNLKVGAAFDYLDVHNQPSGSGDNAWAVAGYASYQATEKLSFHLRGDYINDEVVFGSPDSKFQVFTLTTTVQYDLWKNVLSRLEFRWDHSNNGDAFGEGSDEAPSYKNAALLLANITYKF